MKYILFILITNNILFSQIYGFEEPYKKQIQLGKIDKSKTEFYDSSSNIFSNFKYGFSYKKPKSWDYDNGRGLITVFRTMVIDSGISLSVNVLKSNQKINPSVHDILDGVGFEEYKTQYLKKIGKEPTYFNIEKTFLKDLPSLRIEMKHIEREGDFEIEWNSTSLMFWKKNTQFTIGLNVPYMYYQLNSSYYESLFYGFNFLQSYDDFEFLNENKFKINNKDFRKTETYDLKSMITIFLEDCKLNGISIPDIINISSTFEVLESKTLGISLGMDNDDIVVIKIDPESWSKSSITKRWYLIYHELGHDVLNLKHGEGGKMMFTFSDREYKWEEFFEDKEYMFKYFKKNL
jgi:hypothetical protein